MKRLTILTVIGVMTIASCGCSQMRCWFNRNNCAPCGGEYGAYTSEPVYEGTILPAPATTLPEPEPAG